MSVSRPMGFLEKIANTFHNVTNGATSVTALAEVGLVFDKALFIDAWQVLFQRHPLLRARVEYGEVHSFVFDVLFESVDIKAYQFNAESELKEYFDLTLAYGFETEKAN